MQNSNFSNDTVKTLKLLQRHAAVAATATLGNCEIFILRKKLIKALIE